MQGNDLESVMKQLANAAFNVDEIVEPGNGSVARFFNRGNSRGLSILAQESPLFYFLCF